MRATRSRRLRTRASPVRGVRLPAFESPIIADEREHAPNVGMVQLGTYPNCTILPYSASNPWSKALGNRNVRCLGLPCLSKPKTTSMRPPSRSMSTFTSCCSL